MRTYHKQQLVKTSDVIAKRVIPVILSAALCTYPAVPALAGTVQEKEEVIYINLTAGGSVKEVYAVNIFGSGDIIDYGDYSAVEMLNTTDKISQNGDKITFSTSSERAYYKGTWKSTVIPWNISIRYYLDGKEYTPDKMAGKSGKLEIKFRVTQNKACDGNFFDSYALQAAFTLDTKKCSNITAKEATLANVGSQKQISYTMLPGEGIDTVITADVKDFEMGAVSINGVPLSMKIDVDDEELMEKITELMDAIDELDNGAGDLNDGVFELKDAAKGDLKSGVNDLADGAGKLYSGASDLKDGGETMQGGIFDLQAGASDLDSGMQELNSGISLVQSGLKQLNEKSKELTNGSAKVQEALIEIQTALSSVSASTDEIEQLVSGSAAIQEGIASLADGISRLQENISYTTYKTAMNSQGLDIDTLQAKNTEAVSNLTEQIETLKQQAAALEQMGGNEEQAMQLQASITQLQSVVTLLQGNSAAIGGMEIYLNEVGNGAEELVQGAAMLKEQYITFHTGVTKLSATVKDLLVDMTALKNGIDTLVTEYGALDSGILEYTDGIAELAAGYSNVVSGSSALLAGSSQLKSGTLELYNRTGEMLDGIVEFYNGTEVLKDGTKTLADGTDDLLAGIVELYDGTDELKDGTAKLKSETDGMDTEISDKIDEMLENITGGGNEVVSFISEKNTMVDSVQFVLQTEAVEKEEIDTKETTKAEELTFWKKLIRLFGWNG